MQLTAGLVAQPVYESTPLGTPVSPAGDCNGTAGTETSLGCEAPDFSGATTPKYDGDQENEPSVTRPRVMVIFGGRSSEHQISCATAASIMRAINTDRWDAIFVGITQSGQWRLMPSNPQRFEMLDGHLQSVPDDEGIPVALTPGNGHLVAFEVDGAVDLGAVDVVFPLLHGPFGEDGTIQGLLEMAGVRYVGCGVAASALSMDKHLTKTVLHAAGIEVGRWELITREQWNRDPAQCSARVEALGFPVFVKPCRAGSSIGISKVHSLHELPAAVELAIHHDPRIMVEGLLTGREVECGVLDTPDGPQAAPISEIVLPESQDGFYDFAAKYVDTDVIGLECPADLDEAAAHTIQSIAVRAFEALECEGLARVDFFFDPQSGQATVNEVNTMPGFTPISMYPRGWDVAGLAYPDLVDTLLRQALTRGLGLR